MFYLTVGTSITILIHYNMKIYIQLMPIEKDIIPYVYLISFLLWPILLFALLEE